MEYKQLNNFLESMFMRSNSKKYMYLYFAISYLLFSHGTQTIYNPQLEKDIMLPFSIGKIHPDIPTFGKEAVIFATQR